MGKTTYKPEIGDEICALIADGLSATKALKKLGVPRRSYYRWIRLNEDFARQLQNAREDHADTLADELCDIAETEPDIQRARLKIDARKWVAARMKPKSWGDRQTLEHSGPNGQPITVRDATQLTDDELAAIAAAGRN